MKRIAIIVLILLSTSALKANNKKYRFDNIFTISVSDALELRQEDDAYTKFLRDTIDYLTKNKIVFQQRGLANRTAEALSHYCRIMILTDTDESCPYYCSDESNFSKNDIDMLTETYKYELVSDMYLLKPPTTTIGTTLNGSKYVRISYIRSGLNNKGDVSVHLCYFFNYKYMLKVIFSYRTSEAELWQSALEEAINSISWVHPYFAKNDIIDYIISQNSRGNQKHGHISLFLSLSAIILIVVVLIATRKAKQNRYKKEKLYVEKELQTCLDLIKIGKLATAENKLKSLKEGNLKYLPKYASQAKDVEDALTSAVSELNANLSITLSRIKSNLIIKGEFKNDENQTDIFRRVEIPSHIKNKLAQGLKAIDEEYKKGIIPNQEELYTFYDLTTNVENDNYSFYRVPKRGTIVFPYRRNKIEHRGYTELRFEEKLRASFASDTNYQVLGDVSLFAAEGYHPYEPDISIIERNDKYGIRIDIEIDEPYSGVERKPIHYIGCGDDFRDLCLNNIGWIVIRFSEKQIYTEADYCINYIKYIIGLIDSTVVPDSYDFPSPDKRWTETEAMVMSVMEYREKMLHHSFRNEEKESHLSFVTQTLQEREAATHVQPIVFPTSARTNIDSSSLKFACDQELSFDPKEHIYLYKGIKQLTPISDVVNSYFKPFDSLGNSQSVAIRHGENQCKILEEWDCIGQESKEVGTFLHSQIESCFSGNSPLSQMCFSYKGRYIEKNETISIAKELHLFKEFIKDNPLIPFRVEWQIFDLKLSIAGTIDCICRNGNAFDIYDWKRSKKASPSETVWGYGINGLEHIPDTRFYHYAIQQNLYRYILETNYGLTINKMYIVVLHHQFDCYQKFEVPKMDKEIKNITSHLCLIK